MKKTWLIPSLVCALSSVPAEAGTGLIDTSATSAEITAMAIFASCVAQDAPLADEFLETLPGGARAKKLRERLTQLPCIPAGIKKPDESWVLRGSLYETRWKAKYPGPLPASFAGVGWVDYAFPEGTFDEKRFDGREMANGHVSKLMLDYADCIVRTQPQGAVSLLSTPVASSPERAVAKALAPSLSSCLSKGAKMNLRIWLLRAHIAEAVFKLSEVKNGVPGLTKVSQ